MTRRVFAEVISVEHPAAGFTRMGLAAPELAAARPGQFLTVRCGGGVAPFLRRPFAVFKTDRSSGRIEILFSTVGEGTRWLADRRPGDVLDLLGPLGKPFEPPQPTGRAVLVAGGVGIASLYLLATELARNGWRTSVLLGAPSAAALLCRDDLEDLGAAVEVATDDGSEGHKGPVTDLLPRHLHEADAVFACGPWLMLHKVAAMCKEARVPCQVSLDRRMACGTGACMGCVVQVRTGRGVQYKRVCKDGPVFPAEEIVWGDGE